MNWTRSPCLCTGTALHGQDRSVLTVPYESHAACFLLHGSEHPTVFFYGTKKPANRKPLGGERPAGPSCSHFTSVAATLMEYSKNWDPRIANRLQGTPSLPILAFMLPLPCSPPSGRMCQGTAASSEPAAVSGKVIFIQYTVSKSFVKRILSNWVQEPQIP